MPDFVYAFTNAAMPGLVKIGTTTDLEKRLKDLSSHSGVPAPFECLYAAEVEDGRATEKAIHDTFDDVRLSPSREFFKMGQPHKVVALLKVMDKSKGKATADTLRDKLNVSITPEDRQAIENVSKVVNSVIDAKTEAAIKTEAYVRRQNFTFPTVEIPVGAELVYAYDTSKVCKVVDDRHVEYEGKKDWTLSGLAGALRKDEGYTPARGVQGTLYFMYNGELISERRDRLEEEKASKEEPTT